MVRVVLNVPDDVKVLLKTLAKDRNQPVDKLVAKSILNDAYKDAPALPAPELRERIALIESADRAVNPRKIISKEEKRRRQYQAMWIMIRRLEERGWAEEDIKAKCKQKYGFYIEMDKQPQCSPKKNPNWQGGARWKK